MIVVWQSYSQGRTVFGGFFGDSLHLLGEDGFLGEGASDALNAEQVAVCYALLWILQAPASHGRTYQYQVCYDCLAAGNAASAKQAVVAGSAISQMSRGLAQAVECFLRQPVEYKHVSSHQGHAWNEMADVVAKYCAGVLSEAKALVPTPPSAIARICSDVDWAWTLWDARMGHSLPLVRQGCMQQSATSDPSCITSQSLIPVQERWQPFAGRSPTIPLAILSINLQSLQGKHRFMEEQFVCAGVHEVVLKKMRYDRAKLLSAGGKQQLKEALKSYIPPRWSVHVDDRATQVQGFLQDILNEHLVLDSQGPRAGYISQEFI